MQRLLGPSGYLRREWRELHSATRLRKGAEVGLGGGLAAAAIATAALSVAAPARSGLGLTPIAWPDD